MQETRAWSLSQEDPLAGGTRNPLQCSFFFIVLILFSLIHIWRNKYAKDCLSSIHFSPSLKKEIIYFNWKLITLQYCSGFCHTLTWISHGCTRVPILTPLLPPSSSHPSGLSQSTGFGCPVSCIKLALVICSTCFNAILSNHPTLAFSHWVQNFVLYICVFFAALHVG